MADAADDKGAAGDGGAGAKNDDANAGKDSGGGGDKEVTVKESELKNLTKGRDDERNLRQKAEGDLAKLKGDIETAAKGKQQDADVEKGKFDKVLKEKQDEIDKLKPDADRLQSFLKDAQAENEKTIDLFKDDSQKELVKSAIDGKDAIAAKKILDGFLTQFNPSGKKDKKNIDGAGGSGDHGKKEGISTDLEKMQTEFNDLIKDHKKPEGLTLKQEKRLRVLPGLMKELRAKEGTE